MKAQKILTMLAALLALTVLPGLALADFAYDWDIPETEMEVEVGTIAAFHTFLTNTGSEDDVYYVQWITNAPDSWVSTLCIDDTCLPPWIEDTEIPVSAGNQVELIFDLTPGDAGTGSLTAIITNQNGSGTMMTEIFTVSTPSAFDFDTPTLGLISEVGIIGAFHCTMTNTSASDDILNVRMIVNAPELWSGTMCVGETCYPPFITEVDVPLTADEMTALDVDLYAGDLGEGSITMVITSDNTGESKSETFTLITPGLDVLLVDGDDGMDYETYYQDAIAAAGKSYGTWDRQVMGPLTNLELASFPVVSWVAGTTEGALGSDDMAALLYLVQHGGGLFLSGQNLAYESCDPSSPYYTAATLSWFNGILGAGYSGAAFFPESAFGPEDDFLSGELLFNLDGGTGAGNNESMDDLLAVGTGVVNLDYDTGGVAAVRNSFGSGNSYFCAFAFEGIDTDANRNALMSQVLAWFAGDIVPPPPVAAGDMVKPLIASVPYASPNPFNPQTNIRFEVGGLGDVPAEVVIYNLKGQLVRNLFTGTMTQGPQNLVWDGRGNDGSNMATGVYMAQVRLAEQSKTVKMTLVK